MIIGGLIRDYIIGQVICLRKFSNLPVTKTNVTEVFFGAGEKLGWCDESLATMGFDYGQLNGYDRCFGFKVRPVKDK